MASLIPEIVCPYYAETYRNVREVTACIISVSSCKPGNICCFPFIVMIK